VILRLAVSVEHRLVTDGRTDTDTRRQLIPALTSVARVKVRDAKSYGLFTGKQRFFEAFITALKLEVIQDDAKF